MLFNLILVDYDTVEGVNVDYQAYEAIDVGRKKVYALRDHFIRMYLDIEVNAYDMRVVSLGDLIPALEDEMKQSIILQEVFNKSDVVVATFNRDGLRWTYLVLSIIFDKPAALVYTYTSLINDNG